MMLKLAVIGDPVAHSKSPALHADFLREAGIAGTYEAIRVQAGSCASAVERLRVRGYHGLNVTTPLKEEAHALCVRLDDVARAAGSVNTLTLRAEGVVGANTDGVGAWEAVRAALGADVAGKAIFVLGVGPTARAAVCVLRVRGARVFLWNRTAQRARETARSFEVDVWSADVRIDLALSTLPPHAEISSDALEALRDAPLVLDANYGPRATLARSIGRPTIDGEGMLLAQARASFEIWRASIITEHG
jgi:shikimate dehydrogenase